MSDAQRYYAILCEDKNFSDVLTKLFQNFDRDHYHLKSCGSVWLLAGKGWTLENIHKTIDKHHKKQKSEAKRPAYVVFEIKGGFRGYYYSSIWDWKEQSSANV
jgi:hypothetical protein